MTRAFLIRVGMDSVYGGFVSPIFENQTYVFMPIPNVRIGKSQIDFSSEGLKCYADLKTNSIAPLTDFLPKDRIKVQGKYHCNVQTIKVHNDPEFVTMTYGEKKPTVCNTLREFSDGDCLVFYASFFPLPNPDFRYRDLTLSQLQKEQKRKKQFYIFAFLELKYRPIDHSNYKQYESEISNNAHYLRGDFVNPKTYNKVLVFKGTDRSGCIRPIRIDDGHQTRGNYWMKKEIAQLKLQNKHKRGLNRCYCELEDAIVSMVLSNRC